MATASETAACGVWSSCSQRRWLVWKATAPWFHLSPSFPTSLALSRKKKGLVIVVGPCGAGNVAAGWSGGERMLGAVLTLIW